MSDDEMGSQFPGGPQQVEFWCLEVPPGKKVYANLSDLPEVRVTSNSYLFPL